MAATPKPKKTKSRFAQATPAEREKLKERRKIQTEKIVHAGKMHRK